MFGQGSVRPEKAHTLWSALSEDERQLAIRGARGYRAQRDAARKPLMDPERFLRDPALWTEFASKTSAAATAMRVVPIGSAEGRALRCAYRLAGATPLTFQSGSEPCMAVNGEASPAVLALAPAADERGREVGDWVTLAVGSPGFHAWREFVDKAIKRGLGVRGDTVRVPAPWPPRADGSWPEFQSLDKAG